MKIGDCWDLGLSDCVGSRIVRSDRNTIGKHGVIPLELIAEVRQPDIDLVVLDVSDD